MVIMSESVWLFSSHAEKVWCPKPDKCNHCSRSEASIFLISSISGLAVFVSYLTDAATFSTFVKGIRNTFSSTFGNTWGGLHILF